MLGRVTQCCGPPLPVIILRQMKRATVIFQLIVLLAATAWLSACNPGSPTIAGTTPSLESSVGTPTNTPGPTQRRTATPTAAAQPTPTRAVQISADALEGEVVTFWHPFSGENALTLEQLAGKFNAQNTWGIEIRTQAFAGFGKLEEAYRNAPPAGELPDLVLGYQEQALEWDHSGDGLADLNIYLQDHEWGLVEAAVDAYPEAIWMENLAQSDQNKRLGLPWYRSGLLLAYNQTWAQSLGFDTVPNTVRTLQAQACAAATALKSDALAENDGRGGWLISIDPSTAVSWLYAYQSDLLLTDRSGYALDTTQSRQAFTALFQGYVGNCFWVDDTVSPTEAFATRQAVFVTISPPSLADFANQLSEAGFEDQWIAVALPDLAGEPVVDFYGPALLIPVTKPERQLAAWAFIRWLNEAENLAIWADQTGYLPASTASHEVVENNSPAQPVQWRSTLAFVAQTHGEPGRASWGRVRWAIGEALARVLSPGLKAGDVQTILTTLDRLANDIDHQYP